MSQFDESKVARGGDGRFAEKPPAPEADGVDLSGSPGRVPVGDMDPREGYAQMVLDLAREDPDGVRMRLGVGMSDSEIELRQSLDPSSPEDDEYLSNVADAVAGQGEDKELDGLRQAVEDFDEDRDGAALSEAVRSYLDSRTSAPLAPDEVRAAALADWDAAEKGGEHPAFADHWSQVSADAPYTPVLNAEDQNVWQDEYGSSCGDRSVGIEASVRRTWSTGNPEAPYITVTPTYYVEAYREAEDVEYNHNVRKALRTGVEIDRLEEEAYEAEESGDFETPVENGEAVRKLNTELAELERKTADGPQVDPSESRWMDYSEWEEHKSQRDLAHESRVQAQNIESGLDQLDGEDREKAQAEAERLVRYADGLEMENPGRLRYAVKSQTEWVVHSDRQDPGSSEIASDYVYDDGADVWIDSPEKADEAAIAAARNFDWSNVSTRNFMRQNGFHP